MNGNSVFDKGGYLVLGVLPDTVKKTVNGYTFLKEVYYV